MGINRQETQGSTTGSGREHMDLNTPHGRAQAKWDELVEISQRFGVHVRHNIPDPAKAGRETRDRDSRTRLALVDDASKIIGAAELANGVPLNRVEDTIKQLRNPNRPRTQIRRTISIAQDIISKQKPKR